MRLIRKLQKAGYTLTLRDEKLVYKWTRSEPPEPLRHALLIEELRRQKNLVIEYLRSQSGNCESCPAAGFWDGYKPFGFYPDRYCFHAAYFLGQTAKPQKCDEARGRCPKKAYAVAGHAKSEASK